MLDLSYFFDTLLKPMKSYSTTKSAGVRLDKWLWAARFYKTRAVARDMVASGKVTYNAQRSKPSKIVEVGAQIKVRQGNEEKQIVVIEISDQRRGAPIAQSLYQETPESIKRREENNELRRLNALENPRPDKRPDKKQRRKIIQFKAQ